MPSFAISICVLSAVQAAVVLAPAAIPGPLARLSAAGRLAGRGWAIVPAASVAAVVLAIRAAAGVADGLTYLALVFVPPLAVWALRPATPRFAASWPAAAALAGGLFALAWAGRGELWGDSAALILTAASCVTLGALLAVVTPARLLAYGLLAMAALDTALVVSHLLGPPNDVLNHAHPVAGLPRLQRARFGSALTGYGDFFAAALLGTLAARLPGGRRRAALATLALALALDLLFFAVDELPATVPPALALLLSGGPSGRRPAARRRAGAS